MATTKMSNSKRELQSYCTITLVLFSAEHDKEPKVYLEQTGNCEQMPFSKCYLNVLT